jgi:hypothetical protein
LAPVILNHLNLVIQTQRKTSVHQIENCYHQPMRAAGGHVDPMSLAVFLPAKVVGPGDLKPLKNVVLPWHGNEGLANRSNENTFALAPAKRP